MTEESLAATSTEVPIVPSPGGTPARLSETVEGRPLEVVVDDRGLERALRRLKRRADTEGVTKELKRRRHYEKPSERVRRKKREATRRRNRRVRRMAKKGSAF